MTDRRWKSLALPLAAGILSSALISGAASAQGQTTATPYAALGDWKVEFVPAAQSAPAHCRATKIYKQETALRFAAGARLFAIDFMGDASQETNHYQVEYWIDRDDPGHNASALAQAHVDEEGVDWMRIEEPTDEPGSTDALMNGKQLVIKRDEQHKWPFSLSGVNAIMKSVLECRDAKVPVAPAVAQAAPQAAPQPMPQVAQPAPPPPVAQAAPPAIPPSQTEGRPAECLMSVNGRTYIDGSCRFDADKDGSFRVFGKRHFAYVTVLSPGVAEASWNEDPPTSSAQAPLGEIRRNGACWESPSVRICAWQLGQRPAAGAPPQPAPRVAQAAPPPPAASGRSFYASAEGADQPSLCIDIAGGRIAPGTPIQMWRCHQRAPQRFAVDARRGVIFAAANPGLCVDGFDKQQLALVPCREVGNQWRYDERSATIRSSDGLCWDIAGGNVPQNIRERQRVLAWRCHNGINQRFVLND